MTKFATTSRGCDVSGKCSATRERPSAASTQPTRPRVRHGSDHKTTAALVSQHMAGYCLRQSALRCATYNARGAMGMAARIWPRFEECQRDIREIDANPC